MDINEIKMASNRILSFINQNNFIYAEKLSHYCNTKLFFKLENLQPTGSFKIRGALNAILSLNPDQLEQGIIAASGGNHAQGVAWACKNLNVACQIILPQTASKEKINSTIELGAKVILHGDDFDEASDYARQMANDQNALLIDAVENELVLAGYGTIGLEIMNHLPDVDNVIVPVGAGGLLSAIAFTLKTLHPKLKVYGVETFALSSLTVALANHKPILVPPNNTIADGIRVRKIGDLPFSLLEKYVDGIIRVNENEIASAMLHLLEKEKQVVEAAGAVGVAALMFNKLKFKPNQKSVVLITGGNIDVTLLGDIINYALIAMHRRICFGVIISNKPGAFEELLSQINVNVINIAQRQLSNQINVNEQLIEFIIDVIDRNQGEVIKNKLKLSGYRIIDNEDI